MNERALTVVATVLWVVAVATVYAIAIAAIVWDSDCDSIIYADLCRQPREWVINLGSATLLAVFLTVLYILAVIDLRGHRG